MLSHKDVEVAWYKNGAKLSRTKNVDFGCEGEKHWMVMNMANLDDDDSEISVHAEEEKCFSRLFVDGTFFRIPLLTAMFSIRFDFQCDITVIEICLE